MTLTDGNHLEYSCNIAKNIVELAKFVQNKPFLLHKVQDAAQLLKEVHLSLGESQK